MKQRNSFSPLRHSGLILGMCLFAGAVHAMPTVTGTTISWPDDGWYQVQSADGATNICSGGRSCDVSPGDYLVINHSTGQRSTVTVAGSTEPAPTSITVSGSTVSWPDDGWYQLQTEDGSRSVCQGGTSCDVEPGRYLLINHSTGQRFPGIEVGDSSGPTPPVVDAVTVTGNVISWPDDGWYQVQTADGSSNVCSGGTSCEVSAGTYLLINHTTGQRFDNIVVGDSSPPARPPTGVDTVTVDGTTISWPDNGWYQIQNAETFLTICEGGLSCEVSPGTYFVINHSDGSRQTVSVEGTGGPLPPVDPVTPPVDPVIPPVETETVLVNFDIMVPVFSSDSLQVQVFWGDTRLTAAWLIDESWTVTGELPANTEQPLSIFFNDDNGGLTLASIDTSFRTNSETVQDFQITADQFDSDRWDSDEDGTSNLEERRTGRDPFMEDPTEPAEPEPGESDFQVTVANRDSATLNVSVGVPDPETGELGGDFMILFDRSGSFSDDLRTFRREVNEIELALADSFSNFRIGLGSFVDAPCLDFGSGSDFGYELNLPISAPGKLSETLDELNILSGNDGPESQLEAMRQAMTGEGHIVDAAAFPSCAPFANIMATSPGWADNRVKFLLVSTDADFHRSSDFGYPYQTTVQDVINLATESKTTILFLNSGATDIASDQIANATGGMVSNLGGASEEIVSTLKSAVASTISSVEVSMKPVGEGAEFVTSIDPERVQLNLFEDRNIEFQINLFPALPISDEDRVFTFELVTEAQGAEISRLTVELTVPADS